MNIKDKHSAITSNVTCFSDKTSCDEFGELPYELLSEICSYMDLATLGAVCCVNKRWKSLASHSTLPIIWKKAIYKEMSFGNDKWAQYFGNEVVIDEDREEEFASLPMNEFIKDCRTIKRLFPEDSVKNYLRLIRLPKSINGSIHLNKLCELSKKYFNDLIISERVKPELRKKSIVKSFWVVMTTNIINWKCYDYNELKNIVLSLPKKDLSGYAIPDAFEFLAFVLVESALKIHRSHTSYFVLDKVHDAQMIVSNIPALTQIDTKAISNPYIGITALRRFKNRETNVAQFLQRFYRLPLLFVPSVPLW